MIKRCYNQRCSDYPNYGGRGITVCDKWRDSFAAFYADMGPRPSPQHSIDRKNNDGGYEPDNCRWATRQQQTNNTRANRRLTYCGETKTIATWSRELSLRVHTIHNRIRTGWSIDEALSTPEAAKPHQMLTLDGLTLSVPEWSARLDLARETIRQRLRYGWSIRDALTKTRSVTGAKRRLLAE